MSTYQDAVDHVAAQTETQLTRLWQLLQADQIDRAEFDKMATTVLETAGDRAASLADIALAARLSQLKGQDVQPLGLTVGDLPTKSAIATIGDVATALYFIGVAARGITREAGATIWVQGLKDQGAPGWRRVTSGGQCEVCARLASASFLPVGVPMWRHDGCGCHPDPVLEDPNPPARPDRRGRV